MKRIKKTNFLIGDRYFCAYCGKRVGFLDSYCATCGYAVDWEKCPYCGHSSELMKDGFCQDCGTSPLRNT